MRAALILLSCFILSGCVGNGFTEFYEGMDLAQIQNSDQVQTCSEPIILPLPQKDPDSILAEMYTHGYTLIGLSEWEGPYDEGDNEAFEQGKILGSCLVLWDASYLYTKKGVVSLPTYTPGKTYNSTYSGTVYSGGSMGHYSGTAQTTTPGTWETQTTGYAVDRYGYLGLFFVKRVNNPNSLMVLAETPPDSYFRAMDSRSGCLVAAVMNEGNAYKANIFPGDIIISVNEQKCSPDSPPPLLKPGINALKIYRNGKILEKKISVPTQ